jgi:ribosome-associated toxin RatA of RatAB toxin-antitoxin module
VFAKVEHHAATTGGRPARRFVIPSVVLGAMLIATLPVRAADEQIAVREKDGTYEVRATFVVPRSVSVVTAVLTDYVRIPHYMPEVRTSQLLERQDDRAVVEQEAVAKFLMFSKRVHLILEVQEAPMTIEFRDRCGQSFERYEGAWAMAQNRNETTISYRLTAKPRFDVPNWLLARLLKRDASEMVARLRAEIGAR